MTPHAVTKEAFELAVMLDFFPGFLGLFGVGEVHHGQRLTGAGFLAISGVLYACLAGGMMVSSLVWVIGCLPTAWGSVFCLLLYDIFRVTDRLDEDRS